MSKTIDPGPGYRLLDPESDTKRFGDEFFVGETTKWRVLRIFEIQRIPHFVPGLVYRRKIAQAASNK